MKYLLRNVKDLMLAHRKMGKNQNTENKAARRILFAFGK